MGFFSEGLRRVAAGCLGLIKRLVGPGQQGRQRIVLALPFRHADADRPRDRLAFPAGLVKAPGDERGLVERGARQHGHEFVPAEAGELVGSPEQGLCPP
jgi:hypothetical protein